jgi:4-amino-4-deoxy-L-arabinose transferase-like glycosyltransferase
MRQKSLALLLIVGIAFAVRIAYSLFLGIAREPGPPSSDAAEYSLTAWNLAQGNGFRAHEPGKEGEVLSAYYPPGAPVFYAMLYFIFGKNYAVVRIAQCLISAASVILLFLLARAVVNERAAWVAAVAFAFYPGAIYFSDQLLTETLYMFFLILFLLLCVTRFAPHPSWKTALISGIVMGITALIRPTILPFVPFFVLWGLYVLKGFRAKCLVFLAVAAAYAVLLPWSFRNYYQMHRFMLFEPRTWTEFIGGNNQVVATDPKYAGYGIWYTLVPGWEHKFDGLTQVEREKLAKQLAFQWMSENKDKWGYLLRSKFIRFWSPFLHQENRLNRALMLLGWGTVLVFFIPAAFVTLIKWTRERHPGIIIHLLVASTLITALIFAALPRYRYPIEPFCIILASATVIWLWDRISGKPLPATA